jgi:hypothetical protein
MDGGTNPGEADAADAAATEGGVSEVDRATPPVTAGAAMLLRVDGAAAAFDGTTAAEAAAKVVGAAAAAAEGAAYDANSGATNGVHGEEFAPPDCWLPHDESN